MINSYSMLWVGGTMMLYGAVILFGAAVYGVGCLVWRWTQNVRKM